MRSYRIRFTTLVSILGLFLASALAGHAQGITTAAISGFVTDSDGKPVAGATVTILHEPSGTRAVATTRANGQYNATGLRIGGPYTISIKAQSLVAQPQKDVFLTLTQEETVNFALSSEVIVLDAFRVTEDRNSLFDGSRMGTGTSYSSSDITAVPSIRHDVQDIANMDPRISLTINTSTGEFAVSAQGQNSRYNSFLIDGMQSNDPFGLNANGMSSTRSPIPLDSLAGLNIELNPYDVTRTGFTGALINAVTKSGTNQFHGELYGFYMDKDLRGKNPGTGPTDPFKGKQDTYRDHTIGFNVGGPLVKDKLFFFFAFEDYKKTAAPTNAQQIFRPDDTAAITAAAKVWGYDPGTSVGALTQSAQKTYLAKLDWNINDDQRATFTYRRVDGNFANPADYNGSTYTSFSNHWYQANRISDNFSLQLNSTWTPDFRTDAGFAYIKYNGTATPNGAPFPEVYINGIAGTNLVTGQAVTGQVDLGTNYSYQYNSLNTKDHNGHFYGEYSLGAHTLKIGGDMDKARSVDQFVQYYYGRYAFANVADFAAGKANYLRYNQAAPGFGIDDSTANYSLTNLGALVQDTWKPNSRLTIVGGVRLDYPYLDKKPLYLPSFYNTWGFANNTTGSGNYTISPRLGFNVDLPFERHTQVRGGIGLFQGTNPAVWIANAFTTNGSTNSVSLPAGGSATSTTSPTPAKTYTFNANPLYVQTLPPPGAPTPDINLIDPNFRTPIYWKSNLAFDHTLPWLGIVATAEASFMKVEKSIFLESLNLNKTGTLPDGRDLYGVKLHSNYGSVLELSNTGKGGGEAYTLSLVRPMKKGWSASVAYTHSHTTEVQAMTSSVAFSSFNYRASVNPNDNIARNSYYATPDKFVVSGAKQFNFFGIKGAETTLAAVFRAQTGHAYSWVFASDVNGDGTNGNDSFYVPTGPDDAKVTWADATQKANFFDFVEHSQLKKFKGQIVAPYSAYNPWQKTVDLHFEQAIPIHGSVKLSVFLDCLNFANLLNKDWGIVDGLDFGTGYNGYNRKVASATVANGQYAYTFTPSTLSSQPTFIDLSRWQFQVGAKLLF